MRLGVAVVLLLCALPARASGELTVAAASDLSAALRDVVAAYRQQSGAQVRLSFGSSGNFYAQIRNGAPFDLFFSADIDYPERLQTAGDATDLYEYALGRLVLWARNGVRLDPERDRLEGLRSAAVRKVAIANPQHAPYGRAAVAALQAAGVYEAVKPKLVFGESVSQAAQFVQSGNADAAILALSLALSAPMKAAGRYWTLPDELHPPLRQAAVVIASSPRKDQARHFLAFVRSPAGRAIMQRYGFVVPEGGP